MSLEETATEYNVVGTTVQYWRPITNREYVEGSITNTILTLDL